MEYNLFGLQEFQPLPDVSGSAGGGVPLRPQQADPAIEAAEAGSNLQGILQGAVNVDWTSTADAPKVCERLCHGKVTLLLSLLSPALLACSN